MNPGVGGRGTRPVVTIAVRGGATPPEGLRVYPYTALAPGSEAGWNAVLER